MNKLGVLCYSMCFSVLGPVAVLGLIVLAASNGIPVELTVADVSLERLALVAAGNGTASVAYNLSFAVAVYNPNSVTRVWRAAPLDAELRRLGGRPFGHIRLAGAERERIRQMRSKVYRVEVPVPKSVAVALERDRPDAAAAFRLELIVHGVFKYVPRIGRASRKTTVRCPLRLLPPSTAPADAAASSRLVFKRALPQLCTDIPIEQLM